MIIYWSMIFWTFLIYILYDITHKEEIALTVIIYNREYKEEFRGFMHF